MLADDRLGHALADRANGAADLTSASHAGEVVWPSPESVNDVVTFFGDS